MSQKKMYMSATATAAITAAFFGLDTADAASHQVKPGETLWSISQENDLTVSELKQINNLSSNIIYANQVLKTTSDDNSAPSQAEVTTEESTTDKPAQKSASSYTVVRGDTLSRIASAHQISLQELMTWNNLDTTLIFPGDKLIVGEQAEQTGQTSSPTPKPESKPQPTLPTPSTGDTYVVESGDTLTRIARAHKISVANLKKWNNLDSSLILVGQKLAVKQSAAKTPPKQEASPTKPTAPSTPSAPTAKVDYDVDKLISVAKSATGVPYVWGGQSMNGFDCSGFIHYAYNQAGKSSPRTNAEGYYSRSYSVSNPQVGDLVFFSNTYKKGISHLGIYLGNGDFIHAGSSTGVTITNLSNPYWSKHFSGYKRFY